MLFFSRKPWNFLRGFFPWINGESFDGTLMACWLLPYFELWSKILMLSELGIAQILLVSVVCACACMHERTYLYHIFFLVHCTYCSVA